MVVVTGHQTHALTNRALNNGLYDDDPQSSRPSAAGEDHGSCRAAFMQATKIS